MEMKPLNGSKRFIVNPYFYCVILFLFSVTGAAYNKGNADARFAQHPPLSTVQPAPNLVLIAHWYNDFGLASTELAKGRLGATTWYDWSWARPGNPSGYDSSRHPLLGWYKGDDPIVLDWQCYWLKENGISAVNLAGDNINEKKWRDTADKYHWMYELFNNAPNCKNLQYIVWVQSGVKAGGRAALRAAWIRTLDDIYLRYGNFFYISKGDKKFPVLYLFDGEKLRGSLDQYRGEKNTREFLLDIANQYKEKGFNGITIFSRNPTSTLIEDEKLAEGGVLYYGAGYSEVDGVVNAKSYRDYVEDYMAPPTGVVPNVVTSHESKPPHPSKWTQGGSTPELFCGLLLKAARSAKKIGGKKIVEIYNVAEWAEAGAGLQPNMRDGFGYLLAAKRVVENAGGDRDSSEVCEIKK